MAKRIRQYRAASIDELSILKGGLPETAICQLSIEAPPGTEFNINNSVIRIGVTGIYEVMIDYIESLNLSQDSFTQLCASADNDGNLNASNNIIVS